MNLISVNWEKSSNSFNYLRCANQVEPIGTHLAGMIDFLVENKLVSLNDITLIGFSLGAHIVGIGKYKQKHITNVQIHGMKYLYSEFQLESN